MCITRKNKRIYLNQTAYLSKVLQCFGMTNAHSTVTPLPSDYSPVTNSAPEDPNIYHKFQQLIDSPLYIMLGTWPNITYAVTKLSQFAANPSQDHLNKVMYILHYLVGTSNYALVYDGINGKGFEAYADSDWASNSATLKYSTGYLINLASSVFSWNSRVQKTIALSSTEAKYMALSDTSCQIF